MQGKTIRTYLVDGTADGILTAEIINWTGSISVAPRTQLAELLKREEPRRTGIYFITGTDPEDEVRSLVYVGEGDDVGERLRSHNKDPKKEFWTQAIVVTSKDENLTKSHVRYLESELIRIAKESGRAKVTNDQIPPTRKLPEPDVADMDYFLSQIQLVLPTLGFDFLQPRVSSKVTTDDTHHEVLFEISSGGLHATAVERGAEFVVLKGSQAKKKTSPSLDSFLKLRERLISDSVLVDVSADSDLLEFSEDVAFSSTSAAATIVRGGNRSGPSEWRHKQSGATYGDWQTKRLENL